jgi:hypothetical protein
LSTISQHHWVSKLFGYQFTVEFKPGRLNAAVDALSQRAEKEDLELQTLSIPTFEMFDQFRCEAATLPEIMAKRVDILVGKDAKGWTITNDVVLFQDRIFLSVTSTHWTIVLEQAHGTRHEGVQKTLQRLWASFYMPQDN